MKKLSLLLVVLIFASNAGAVTCDSKEVKLELNSASTNDCKKLSIDGTYQLKLCDNEQGRLNGSDQTTRYLYVDDGIWMARQELVSYDKETVDEEIFKFDKSLSEFSIFKTITKFSGKVIKQFKCNGLVKESI